MDVTRVARELYELLERAGVPARAEQEKRYLRSDLRHLGVRVPEVRKIARNAFREHRPRHDELVHLVEELWARPVHESRVCAVELLGCGSELLRPGDLQLVERLAREARTWALVDRLASRVASSLVERYPELYETLDRWAIDGDFWLRRSALLALLPQVRNGRGSLERAFRYADAMLDEREFFIRKGIGWVLREAARSQPDLVYRWLTPRAARASGVTVREAVKYLSPVERDAILLAHRRARSGIPCSSGRAGVTSG